MWTTGPLACVRSAGLTNGDSYSFTVTATNSLGTGAPRAPRTSVVPAVSVPAAPAGRRHAWRYRRHAHLDRTPERRARRSRATTSTRRRPRVKRITPRLSTAADPHPGHHHDGDGAHDRHEVLLHPEGRQPRRLLRASQPRSGRSRPASCRAHPPFAARRAGTAQPKSPGPRLRAAAALPSAATSHRGRLDAPPTGGRAAHGPPARSPAR